MEIGGGHDPHEETTQELLSSVVCHFLSVSIYYDYLPAITGRFVATVIFTPVGYFCHRSPHATFGSGTLRLAIKQWCPGL